MRVGGDRRRLEHRAPARRRAGARAAPSGSARRRPISASAPRSSASGDDRRREARRDGRRDAPLRTDRARARRGGDRRLRHRAGAPGGERRPARGDDRARRPATSCGCSRRGRRASSPTRARSRRRPSATGPSPCATSAAARSEITIGDRGRGSFWSESIDLGSLRLTALLLRDDPPTPEQLAEAEALRRRPGRAARPARGRSRRSPSAAAPARSRSSSAAASTRRALDAACCDTIVAQPSRDLARQLSLDEPRAATLAAGAIILRELTRCLGTPLQLGAGGLREGAAARLLATRAAPPSRSAPGSRAARARRRTARRRPS